MVQGYNLFYLSTQSKTYNMSTAQAVIYALLFAIICLVDSSGTRSDQITNTNSSKSLHEFQQHVDSPNSFARPSPRIVTKSSLLRGTTGSEWSSSFNNPSFNLPSNLYESPSRYSRSHTSLGRPSQSRKISTNCRKPPLLTPSISAQRNPSIESSNFNLNSLHSVIDDPSNIGKVSPDSIRHQNDPSSPRKSRNKSTPPRLLSSSKHSNMYSSSIALQPLLSDPLQQMESQNCHHNNNTTITHSIIDDAELNSIDLNHEQNYTLSTCEKVMSCFFGTTLLLLVVVMIIIMV